MPLKDFKIDANYNACRVDRIGIIGLGLIGGSLGLALSRRGLAREIVGYDRNPDAIAAALDMGAINSRALEPEKAVEGAGIVILSVPVGTLAGLAKTIASRLSPGTIVTDTGSVKQPIVEELEAIFQPQAFYIGGHPMAGSEQAGIGAADPYLLENAVYVLTPTSATNPLAMKKLSGILQMLGSRIITLKPDEHDLIVAGISHLPHLLAISLMQTAGELAREHPMALMLAAGGFRDTTRIAAGETVMWRDIFIYNRSAILSLLKSWRRQIDILQMMITCCDAKDLEQYLQQARELRSQVPARQKGLLPTLHELVVTVPDLPGMIGNLAGILGEAGINIIDIEILRVREGEGGSIRLGFTTAAVAAKAKKMLQNAGIRVSSL